MVLLVSLLSIVIALLASLAIHHGIEKPILRLLSGRWPASPPSLGALPVTR